MEREKFLSILRELRLVCDEVNKENSNSEISYELLQFSDLARKWDSVYKVANFYNHNWLGNVDFMHIPDFYQTLRNCLKYPIIIARKKDTDQILGISTIKYDENNTEHIDPYFPEQDAKYFSITGILTKKDNTFKGIGKKIYEIAIKGAYNYEKHYPGTRIMCVIDCRNKQSMRALTSASENIRNSNYVGEGKELPAYIAGFYELKGNDGKLLEAPTLVMEVGLCERECRKQKEVNDIEFENIERKELFSGLSETLKSSLERYEIMPATVMQDEDCGMVYFYSLGQKERCRLESITIISNNTEKGNNRIPRKDEEIFGVMGPMPSISVEEER